MRKILFAVHVFLRLQLHGVIYRPDSFVLMVRYCANLKAIRYESTSFNRIVADKSCNCSLRPTFLTFDELSDLASRIDPIIYLLVLSKTVLCFLVLL